MDSKDNRVPDTTGWRRRGVAILLLVVGGVFGIGQKMMDRIPTLLTGSLQKNEMREANQRIDAALKTILGVSEASADVPSSCEQDQGCEGSCCGCTG